MCFFMRTYDVSLLLWIVHFLCAPFCLGPLPLDSFSLNMSFELQRQRAYFHQFDLT